MARNHPVSFPWFPSDALGSARIAAMLPEQEGAYRRLLDYCWIEPTCCLAADDASLAMMTKLGSRWRKLKGAVLACFEVCPDHPDRITNRKLWTLRQEDEAYRDSQSEAGSRGARRRWGSNGNPKPSPSPADGNPINPPMATPMANDSSPSPYPSPSSVPRKEPQKTHKRARELPSEFSPNDGHRELATAHGVDCDLALQKFVAYARANGRTQVDWNAAFTQWILNTPRYDRPQNGVRPSGPGGGFKTAGEKTDDAFARVAAKLVAEGKA